MILVFAACKNKKEAIRIGLAVLQKRLAACVLILPSVDSFFLWPPRKNKLVKAKEAVLLLKTVAKKYKFLEREVVRLHSYDIPCIFEIPVQRLNQSYRKWIEKELK